jgi:hypothetical protein
MSENTGTTTSAPETTESRPTIQLLEQPEAGGCCGGGSCGI